MKQEMMGWQLCQLNHMQVICTSLQTDYHISTTNSLKFFTGRMLFLTPNQQCQSTEGNRLTCVVTVKWLLPMSVVLAMVWVWQSVALVSVRVLKGNGHQLSVEIVQTGPWHALT